MNCINCDGLAEDIKPVPITGHNKKCLICGHTFSTYFLVNFDDFPEHYKFLMEHAAVENRSPAIQLIDNVRIIKEYFKLP